MNPHVPTNRADETAIVIAFRRPMAPGDVKRACDCLRASVLATGATLVICDVSGLIPNDAATVDLIARLALTARRARCRTLIAGASGELLGLLDLCGLAGVLPTTDGQASSRG